MTCKYSREQLMHAHRTVIKTIKELKRFEDLPDDPSDRLDGDHNSEVKRLLDVISRYAKVAGHTDAETIARESAIRLRVKSNRTYRFVEGVQLQLARLYHIV